MPDQVPLEDMIAIEEAANEAAAEQADVAPVERYQPEPAQVPVPEPLPDFSGPAPEPEQPWAAAPEVSTVEEKTAAIPEQRSGRKKRGERVPKGKLKKRGGGGQEERRAERKEKREQAKPSSSKSRSASTVVDAPTARGLSLFAKVCLGIAGVALVALGAVFGIPAIMGNNGDDQLQLPAPNENGKGGAALLNPNPPTLAAGMTPNANAANVSNAPSISEKQPANRSPEIEDVVETSSPNRLPDPPSDDSSPAVGSTNTTLPASMTTYTPEKNSILVKPRQTLDAFMAATNWKERIKFVTGGQELASEMRSYYTKYPDGPLDPISINWTLNDVDPDGKTEIFVFTTSFDVESEDGLIYLDFPAVVEGVNGKFTVNWRSFVEFKDRHLNEFVTKRAFNKPQKFHVIALRSHFFGSDPELKSKVEKEEFVCVKVNSPNPDDGLQAFLSTRNPSGKEMAAGLLWEKAAGGHFDTPLVELCWKKTSSGTPYVEITQVLGDKWRDTPK